MYRLIFLDCGNRKEMEIKDLALLWEEAVRLDNDGLIVSSVEKLNSRKEVIKTLFNINDFQNSRLGS